MSDELLEQPADDSGQPEAENRDEVLAAAIKAWCDAEIAEDPDYSNSTIIGEWYLVISRSGFDEEGNPISQTLDTSDGSPTRLLGLVRLSQIKLEQYLLA